MVRMDKFMAEMVRFELTCHLRDKRISSASRYNHFDTSPYCFSYLLLLISYLNFFFQIHFIMFLQVFYFIILFLFYYLNFFLLSYIFNFDFVLSLNLVYFTFPFIFAFVFFFMLHFSYA